MNIVDSSAWLEYFADTKYAKNFTKVIEQPKFLLVPSIILYEVFKKVLSEKDENTALRIVAHMKLGEVIDLDMEIALQAAKLSSEYKLPMADSVILATAQKYNAVLWTQDSDFKRFDKIKYFSKK